MSGDYSRVRFDPRLDMAAVLMQQGRVQLDSDWNEWVAVLDRRLRAGSVDTFGVNPQPGVVGVAVVSPQTPDAFKVEAAGGNITIGRGRMYVDGLLAENHGGGTLEFDPVLAELRGQMALDYGAQPYFPAPPALTGGGPYLTYLEVWQREMTYLERPDLVESAVGVDTTTRWQTVWQVRLLTNIGTAGCNTPDAQFPAWQALIRPSAGRLSIKAEGVPPDQDPCELPPSGGYRGLENQLYRIEIHDGAGAATFKWSRDNASVGSDVVEVVSHTATGTELKLSSLGRDAVLRFNTGDWVEILDDRRELSGENGDPALRRGVMRKITVDDAKQTISFSPALPADLIPAGGIDTLAARHTRVKRWDQKGTVRDANDNVIVDLDAAGSGVIPVPPAGVWVVLENGVQVQFSLDPSGGGFHCGDYWVSAARTVGTSVETFTDSPPLGIHRHYARLAIVSFPDSETDCRTHWPPACGGCCTLTVAPGESIQAALDALPPEGGCVCLKTGIHELSAPIELRASHIILRGEAPGAIVSSNSSPLLQIGDTATPVSDIAVESIRFEAAGIPAGGEVGVIVNVNNCSRLRIEHCEMVVTAGQSGSYIGAFLTNVTGASLTRNRFQNLIYGVWIGTYEDQVEISHNLIEGVSADYLGAGSAGGQYGVWVNTSQSGACRIEHNFIQHFWVGVHLHQEAQRSVVANNRVSRSGVTTVQDTFPTDNAALRAYLDTRLYAIDVEASDCEVRGNHIDLLSAVWGGIRATAAHVKVTDNTLEANPGDKELGSSLVPAGVYCSESGSKDYAADHAVVRNNHLLGPQSGVVVSRLDGATVAGNHIDGGGHGWYGVLVDECRNTWVRDNDIQEVWFAAHLSQGERNRLLGNHIHQTLLGITSGQEAYLELSGNTLVSCFIGGIGLFTRRATSVLENRVMNCGHSGAMSFGVLVFGEELYAISGAMLRVGDCEVNDTGISPDGGQVSGVPALGIGAWVPACQITGNRVGYTDAGKLQTQQQHRALFLVGPIALRYVFGSGAVEYMFGSALVSGNHFRGPGRSTLVEFFRLPVTDNIDFRFEKVTFSNNVCDHLSAEASPQTATVQLLGGHLIAMGNHVKAAADVNAMSLANRNKIALVGNVTTGDYINVGTVTPAPVLNFNVRV